MFYDYFYCVYFRNKCKIRFRPLLVHIFLPQTLIFNPLSLLADVVRPLILQTINSVKWNSLNLKKSLHLQVANIKGLESLSLWHKFSYFVIYISIFPNFKA